MRHLRLPMVALLIAVAGCVAPVEDDPGVSASSAALTLEECAEIRAECYARNPFFGLFTCPLQYNQCALTADNGIPAQVTAAIGDAADCAQQGIACRAAAESPEDLLICTETEALCVAEIVDVELPRVVSGTLECVDGAVSCINAAESVGDLAGCADTLQQCALEQATSILPPEIGEVVEDVGVCQMNLSACTIEATTPSELTQCSTNYIECVADGLGVDLPGEPIGDALACAETATACTLDARSLSDLGGCADGLIMCTTSLIQEQLTCEQQWTACLNANPFNFLGCSFELAFCAD